MSDDDLNHVHIRENSAEQYEIDDEVSAIMRGCSGEIQLGEIGDN